MAIYNRFLSYVACVVLLPFALIHLMGEIGIEAWEDVVKDSAARRKAASAKPEHPAS